MYVTDGISYLFLDLLTSHFQPYLPFVRIFNFYTFLISTNFDLSTLSVISHSLSWKPNLPEIPSLYDISMHSVRFSPAETAFAWLSSAFRFHFSVRDKHANDRFGSVLRLNLEAHWRQNWLCSKKAAWSGTGSSLRKARALIAASTADSKPNSKF